MSLNAISCVRRHITTIIHTQNFLNILVLWYEGKQVAVGNIILKKVQTELEAWAELFWLRLRARGVRSEKVSKFSGCVIWGELLN